MAAAESGATASSTAAPPVVAVPPVAAAAASSAAAGGSGTGAAAAAAAAAATAAAAPAHTAGGVDTDTFHPRYDAAGGGAPVLAIGDAARSVLGVPRLDVSTGGTVSIDSLGPLIGL